MYLFGVEGATFERGKKASSKSIDEVYSAIKEKLLSPKSKNQSNENIRLNNYSENTNSQ